MGLAFVGGVLPLAEFGQDLLQRRITRIVLIQAWDRWCAIRRGESYRAVR